MTSGGGKKLDPLLEQVIAAGLMTREEAERVDAWADDLATRKCAGEVTDDEVSELVRDRATLDALAALKRRRKQS